MSDDSDLLRDLQQSIMGSSTLADFMAVKRVVAMIMSLPEPLSDDAVSAFSKWLNEGPRLAKAAGCYVGIKVTEADTPSNTTQARRE